MNNDFAAHQALPRRRFSALLMVAFLSGAMFAGGRLPLLAQNPEPTASPATTPPVDPGPTATPVASPSPTPVPGDAGATLTVTPGVPDAATEADYISARTPQANVVLTTSTAGTNATKSAVVKSLANGRAQAAANPSSAIQLSTSKGVFQIVYLTSTPAAGTNSKTAQTATSASATTGSAPTVPLAVVSLNYSAAWAGQTVFVRTLGGGSVSATDADGNLCTATTDGFYLTLDTAGTGTFGFQAPNSAQTCQVYTRLDNVATTFTFTVPDANL